MRLLPAGGRVALLLETDDVYMTVFLPDKVIGKIKIGDEAQIALDALKGTLPAYISFVSPKNRSSLQNMSRRKTSVTSSSIV